MKKHTTKQITALFLALLVLAGFSGCSLVSDMLGLGLGPDQKEQSEPEPEEDPEYPVILQGVEIDSRPGKIVSLSPAITDKLFDLGAGDRLLGVSDSCDNRGLPANIARCGTPLLADIDAVLALEPHVVLAPTALPQEQADALEKAGIAVLAFPYVYSLDDLYGQYIELSILLEGQQTGLLLGEDFVEDFRQTLSGYRDAVGSSEPKKAAYLRLFPFTIAPGNCLENELMGYIGLENIASGNESWDYPAEDAGANRADFEALDVFFLASGYVAIKDLEGSEFYKGLQATLQDWYLEVDPAIFERQSLAMLDLLEDMLLYAHPGAALPSASATPSPAAGGAGDEEAVEAAQAA